VTCGGASVEAPPSFIRPRGSRRAFNSGTAGPAPAAFTIEHYLATARDFALYLTQRFAITDRALAGAWEGRLGTMAGMERQRVGMRRGVGILHPGAMGAQVGAQVVAAGAGSGVWWVGAGRSAETRARADAAGLRDAGSLDALADGCEVILSVCPPAFARSVARSVADTGFSGVYVDANAISPEHAVEVASRFDGQARVVDGGIIGGPPRHRGEGATRLYLSGPDDVAVEQVRALFDGTALEPHVLPGPIGQASALKLAFASFNKISYLLAAQAYGLAAGHGVDKELHSLAAHIVPGTLLASPEQLTSAGPRAWRWAPEMDEIAAACTAIGLPGDAADAASAAFARWADLKGRTDVELEELLGALRK
jgi:3-hydroxyisobutyrate dehydrogenase-like beta-hydroxyacid dehydrogenase